ncbi:MAG: tetratricopeptide repeat protein [Verrucomicrobiales bacterium]|nr:tetratricopeptide repeat protein [Verrucomicrobiales bacterium]
MSRFHHLEFTGATETAAQVVEQATLPASEVDCLATADRAFRAGDFEQALRHYARVLEEDARCAPAWVGQAQMLIELGEPGEARLWAEKGLEQLPEEGSLLAAKAVAVARLGDREAGRVWSDNAMESPGEAPYLWLARGEVLLARREKPSDYCLDRAIALGGGDWLWPWLASRALAFHDRFGQGLQRAQLALTLASGEAVVWAQLAVCQAGMGLIGHAEHSLAQARELNPRCPEGERVQRLLRDGTGWSRWLGRLRHWAKGPHP